MGTACHAVVRRHVRPRASSLGCHASVVANTVGMLPLSLASSSFTQPGVVRSQLLDSWSRLPDGRFTGTLGDRTVWLTVGARSRVLDLDLAGPKHIETMAGAVYELGEPHTPSRPTLLPLAWAAPAWLRDEDLPHKIASAAGAAVLLMLAALAMDTREMPSLVSEQPAAAASQQLVASTAVAPASAPSLAAAAVEHAATTSAAAAVVAGYALAADPADGAAAVEHLVAAAAAEHAATTVSAAATIVAQYS